MGNLKLYVIRRSILLKFGDIVLGRRETIRNLMPNEETSR
jgi:hypothetical protein